MKTQIRTIILVGCLSASTILGQNILPPAFQNPLSDTTRASFDKRMVENVKPDSKKESPSSAGQKIYFWVDIEAGAAWWRPYYSTGPGSFFSINGAALGVKANFGIDKWSFAIEKLNQLGPLGDLSFSQTNFLIGRRNVERFGYSYVATGVGLAIKQIGFKQRGEEEEYTSLAIPLEAGAAFAKYIGIGINVNANLNPKYPSAGFHFNIPLGKSN